MPKTCILNTAEVGSSRTGGSEAGPAAHTGVPVLAVQNKAAQSNLACLYHMLLCTKSIEEKKKLHLFLVSLRLNHPGQTMVPTPCTSSRPTFSLPHQCHDLQSAKVHGN